MSENILDHGRLLALRERAQREDLRNRVIIDHFSSPEGPRCSNGCGNLLTIEDRFSECRQCILDGGRSPNWSVS